MNQNYKKSIFYIHGYLSTPDGGKGTILKQGLGAVPIKYRDDPPEELVIRDCLDEIKKVIQNQDEIVLIGSSLGGFLASEIAFDFPNRIHQLILLNPAVIPPEVDIKSISDMPFRILQDMKDHRLFTSKLKTKITIFSATEDTVVSPEWVIRFAQFQEATVQFLSDDHRFSAHLDQLPMLIKTFL